MANSLFRSRDRVSNGPVRRWLIVACATCWGIFQVVALCDDHVSGNFTAKGKSVELHHVYAFWRSRATDESKFDMYVLLSDQVIAPDSLPANDSAIAKMAELVRADKIHAFELHFDGTTKRLFEGEQGAVYHNGIAMARQGVTGMLQYRPDRSEASAVAGSVSVDKDFVDTLGWTCSASFQVAIPAKP